MWDSELEPPLLEIMELVGLSVSELRSEVKCNNHSCLLLYPKTRYFAYLVQRSALRFVLSVDVALDMR